jgi:serine protease inhibitor
VALLVAGALLTTSACSGTGGTPAPGSASPSAAVLPPGGGSPTAAVPVAAAQEVKASVARAKAAANPGPAATAIDAFGIDLYRRLTSAAAAGASPNVAFSPASIALALAMVRPGAKGTTAVQMDAVLHGLGADTASLDAINSLDQALATRSRSVQTSQYGPLEVTLRVVDAAFAQQGETFGDAYLQVLASKFGAGVHVVDFRGNAGAARDQVNAWVRDQTNGKIPAIAGPDAFSPDTILALANAVYLKAPWEERFDLGAPRTFTRPDGSTVTAPMMAASFEEAAYAKGTSWQAIDLPYVGGGLAMTVILPTDLATFESAFDQAVLDRISGALKPRMVHLEMPPFSLVSQVDLKATLGAMGMPDLFNESKADLTGISPNAAAVSRVLHETHVSVDQNGTEAAAATFVGAIAAATMADPPVTLTVDHPFLFVIRDVPTGAILFLGRVGDPTIGG